MKKDCLKYYSITEIDYKIKTSDVTDFNQAEYEIWVQQKARSTKEYKKLKEIEK